MRTPNSPLRGLERIHLDFKAPSLIALFCVQLPMFGAEFEGWSCLPSVTNIIGDADILGGTQELVLDFGGRYLDSDIVTKDHRDYGISLWNRPDMTWCKSDQVCILGEVVDRILSFAWMLDSGYIRHIRKIRIQGPVQEWVSTHSLIGLHSALRNALWRPSGHLTQTGEAFWQLCAYGSPAVLFARNPVIAAVIVQSNAVQHAGHCSVH